MHPFAIRPARHDDLDRLLTMMVDFNAFEGIPYDPSKVRPALERLVDDPRIGFVRVAEHEGVVAAYVVVTFGFDLEFAGRDAFVTELFVDAAHRRSGLARALLEAAERDARANEVRALHLVVRPENPNAIALYASQGFATVPRRVMTKKLPPAG